MGFYRAIPQGTPYTMSGGFCYSGQQKSINGFFGYLTQIRFNNKITSLNITNARANTYDFSDPNYPDYPVWGTSTSSANNVNNVNGLNISNYDKLYLNDNCANLFSNCNNCTNWDGLNKLDFTYVTNCLSMFYSCNNFNQPVTIPNRATNCSHMFHGCRNFNQPVIIGNNVINCANMLSGCNNFNQPVIIGNNVINCATMLFNCTNFNQPITIGNNVIDCYRMLYNCSNFNQSVTIPNYVNNCHSMLMMRGPSANRYSATTIPVPNIYVKGTTFREISVYAMLGNMRQVQPNNGSPAYFEYSIIRTSRTNIYFNTILQNQFNIVNNKSLVGTPITWTALEDGNGYYNTQSNIWLYNNYEG